jgi:hypothetical protein
VHPCCSVEKPEQCRFLKPIKTGGMDQKPLCYSNYLRFYKTNRFSKPNQTDFVINHKTQMVFNDFVIHGCSCIIVPYGNRLEKTACKFSGRKSLLWYTTTDLGAACHILTVFFLKGK